MSFLKSGLFSRAFCSCWVLRLFFCFSAGTGPGFYSPAGTSSAALMPEQVPTVNVVFFSPFPVPRLSILLPTWALHGSIIYMTKELSCLTLPPSTIIIRSPGPDVWRLPHGYSFHGSLQLKAAQPRLCQGREDDVWSIAAAFSGASHPGALEQRSYRGCCASCFEFRQDPQFLSKEEVKLRLVASPS